MVLFGVCSVYAGKVTDFSFIGRAKFPVGRLSTAGLKVGSQKATEYIQAQLAAKVEERILIAEIATAIENEFKTIIRQKYAKQN